MLIIYRVCTVYT